MCRFLFQERENRESQFSGIIGNFLQKEALKLHSTLTSSNSHSIFHSSLIGETTMSTSYKDFEITSSWLIDFVKKNNNSGIELDDFKRCYDISVPKDRTGNIMESLARNLFSRGIILHHNRRGKKFVTYVDCKTAIKYGLQPPPQDAKIYATLNRKIGKLTALSLKDDFVTPPSTSPSLPPSLYPSPSSSSRGNVKRKYTDEPSPLSTKAKKLNTKSTATKSKKKSKILQHKDHIISPIVKHKPEQSHHSLILPRFEHSHIFFILFLIPHSPKSIRISSATRIGPLGQYLQGNRFYFSTCYIGKSGLSKESVLIARAKHHSDRGSTSEHFITVHKSLKFVENELLTPGGIRRYLRNIYDFITERITEKECEQGMRNLLGRNYEMMYGTE